MSTQPPPALPPSALPYLEGMDEKEIVANLMSDMQMILNGDPTPLPYNEEPVFNPVNLDEEETWGFHMPTLPHLF